MQPSNQLQGGEEHHTKPLRPNVGQETVDMIQSISCKGNNKRVLFRLRAGHCRLEPKAEAVGLPRGSASGIRSDFPRFLVLHDEQRIDSQAFN